MLSGIRMDFRRMRTVKVGIFSHILVHPPIITTVVGVAVFSVMLNSRVIVEKMQMSTPLPANDVNTPIWE